MTTPPQQQQLLQQHHCYYLPCRQFPNEVENYFCLQCKEPASAMSFLVGTHFNHPRRLLTTENLDQFPIELWSSEVAEFRSVSNHVLYFVEKSKSPCQEKETF